MRLRPLPLLALLLAGCSFFELAPPPPEPPPEPTPAPCSEQTAEVLQEAWIDSDEVCADRTCVVVTGTVDLVWQADWQDLAGLHCLVGVGEDLRFIGASGLQTMAGLDRLEFVRGRLDLSSMPLLTDVDGLEGLTEVHWLDLSHLPAMEDWSAIEGLDTVGYVTFGGDLGPSPPRFPALTRVELGLYVSPSRAGAMPRFPALESTPELIFSGIDGLLALDGYPALRQVGEQLLFRDLPETAELGGFDALTTVGSLELIDLRSLERAPALRRVGPTLGALHLDDVAGLEPDDLGEVVELGSLRVVDVEPVMLAAALSGLERISGPVSVSQLYSTGLDFLAGVELEGGLQVESEPLLLSLSQASFAPEQTGSVTLRNLPSLESLDELSTVRSIDGDLVLHELDGITSLAPLAALEAVTGDLVITDNLSLPQEEVDAFVAGVAVYGGIWSDGNGGWGRSASARCP